MQWLDKADRSGERGCPPRHRRCFFTWAWCEAAPLTSRIPLRFLGRRPYDELSRGPNDACSESTVCAPSAAVARGLIRAPRDANLDGDRQRAGCPYGGRAGLDDRISNDELTAMAMVNTAGARVSYSR